MDGNWYIVVRVLHILATALWIGAASMLAWVVMPAISDAGAAGGQVMVSLHRRRMRAYLTVIAVLAVVTGTCLYWRLTAGFDPAAVLSRSGMIFGLGGLCGLLALIVGASVSGPALSRIAALAWREATSLPDTRRLEHAQRLLVMQRRRMLANRIVLGLLVLALALMATGHYV